MITQIMKHEWRLLLRDRLLFIAIPIYALLLAYGVYNGVAWRHFLTTNVAAATATADDNIGKLAEKAEGIERGEPYGAYEDPRIPGRFARSMAFEMAVKPPGPTSAIAIGQSDVYPSYLLVQWRAMFNQSNTDEVENPVNLAVGRFDLSFVLIYLYPLLIIALSFNMLSSEREGGTQVLMLSQPVSVGQFVIGKVTVRGLVIIGMAVTLSLLGVMASGAELADGGLWRLGAWGLAIIAYGGFWFGLSVLVNAFAGKSSTNAMVLMGTWLVLVLLAPAVLNLVAKSTYPLPSRIELVQAARRGYDAAKRDVPPGAQAGGAAAELASRGGEDVMIAELNTAFKDVIPLEMRGEAAAAPMFTRFDEQRDRQHGLIDRLKYVSPAILAADVMGELADTSTASYRAFSHQVGAYHARWRDHFFDRIMAGPVLGPADIRATPRFNFVPEENEVVAARVVPGLAALLGFVLAIFAAGFWKLRQYPAAAR